MKNLFYVLWSLILLEEGMAQAKKISNKKYQYLDLGKLQIEGRFVAPTDIFIQEQARRKIKQKLYDRKHFKKEIHRDVLNIR